jgi:hypothetical protein
LCLELPIQSYIGGAAYWQSGLQASLLSLGACQSLFLSELNILPMTRSFECQFPLGVRGLLPKRAGTPPSFRRTNRHPERRGLRLVLEELSAARGVIGARGACTRIPLEPGVVLQSSGCSTSEPPVPKTGESEPDACILPLLIGDLLLSRQTGGQLLTEEPAPTFHWARGRLAKQRVPTQV